MIEIHSHLAAINPVTAIQTAWTFLQKGGVFMIPLGITSIAGMTAVLYKVLSLSRSRNIPARLARQVENFQELAAADKIEPVLAEFEKGESALARLSAVAVRHRGKPHRDINMAVESAAREETARLHAGIGVLDTVITISPLLGLLGTASGLVTIFEGLGEEANYLTIARGIAEAMTTTIFGLAIAVPGVIAHGYFSRKIEMITVRLEALLAGLAQVCQKTAPKS
jgi:biopolymer transport protein ExbB